MFERAHHMQRERTGNDPADRQMNPAHRPLSVGPFHPQAGNVTPNHFTG